MLGGRDIPSYCLLNFYKNCTLSLLLITYDKLNYLLNKHFFLSTVNTKFGFSFHVGDTIGKFIT